MRDITYRWKLRGSEPAHNAAAWDDLPDHIKPVCALLDAVERDADGDAKLAGVGARWWFKDDPFVLYVIDPEFFEVRKS